MADYLLYSLEKNYDKNYEKNNNLLELLHKDPYHEA